MLTEQVTQVTQVAHEHPFTLLNYSFTGSSCNQKLIQIDNNIVDFIKALWCRGIETRFSCENQPRSRRQRDLLRPVFISFPSNAFSVLLRNLVETKLVDTTKLWYNKAIIGHCGVVDPHVCTSVLYLQVNGDFDVSVNLTWDEVYAITAAFI